MTRLLPICILAAIALTAILGVARAAPSNLTVAFVGDQGTGENARAVLQLIADEGTDLLLIQGDLGYDRGAAAQWIRNIDEILGPDFPVLVTLGNHEDSEWPVYRQWATQRILDVPDLICQGDPGVKAHCTFQGLSVVQTAPGIQEVEGVLGNDDYAAYIDEVLAEDSNVWRICSWHKNQQDMQVGGKGDSVGWEVYAACLKHGGIIATAHEHSYSRTFLMNDFETRSVVHRGGFLEIRPGQSIAFVSGLGGRNIRDQERSGDWWASVYTATQDANHGALFCRFESLLAECRFRAIDGTVPDRFLLENRNRSGNRAINADAVQFHGSTSANQTGIGALGLTLLSGLTLLLFRRYFIQRIK